MATEAWKKLHPEQMKEYRRKHYHANKNPYIARAQSTRIKRKEWNKEFKKTLKCARCPERYWACLQFHHKDPANKTSTINAALGRGWSIKRILEEIAKCEVLCANCHAKEHNPS